MKNFRLPILVSSAIILLLASCKKEDFNKASIPQDQNPELNKTSNAKTNPQMSAWIQPSQWKEQSKNETLQLTASITEASLSSEVVRKGLVLVFAKTSSSLYHTLPFHLQGADWIYQVNENEITVLASGKSSIDKNISFAYIIFSDEQLNQLEKKGYDKAKLMQLNYQEALHLMQ